MATLTLGNTAPLEVWKPDETTTDVKSKPLTLDNGRKDNDTETVYSIPPSTPVGDVLQQVQSSWYSHHSAAPPAWVDSDDQALAAVVAQSFAVEFTPDGPVTRDIPVGRPKGWASDAYASNIDHGAVKSSGKRSGSKNRVPLLSEARELSGLLTSDWPRELARLERSDDPLGLKVNSGNDLQASVMGGDVITIPPRTSTGAAATSLTDTGAAFPTSGNGLKGHVVVVADATTSAYAVITSNTATVLTVDKWYDPNNPGGTAATTPAATTRYVVLGGGQPAFWMAITTTVITPAAGDTTLSGELTTTTLARKVATYSHTLGTNTYALAATFTNPDATARTINTMAIFNSGPAVGGLMVFESQVPNPPVLASSSDTVSITDTVTM